MLEGVVAGAEHALERLAGQGVVRRLVVHVVVAGAVVPGDAARADHAVVAVVEGQVVEHQVAQPQAEGGRERGQAGDDVVAHVPELHFVLRLRVGQQKRVEIGRFVLPAQDEIDARR